MSLDGLVMSNEWMIRDNQRNYCMMTRILLGVGEERGSVTWKVIEVREDLNGISKLKTSLSTHTHTQWHGVEYFRGKWHMKVRPDAESH